MMQETGCKQQKHLCSVSLPAAARCMQQQQTTVQRAHQHQAVLDPVNLTPSTSQHCPGRLNRVYILQHAAASPTWLRQAARESCA
jgi:hypothetical protein